MGRKNDDYFFPRGGKLRQTINWRAIKGNRERKV